MCPSPLKQPKNCYGLAKQSQNVTSILLLLQTLETWICADAVRRTSPFMLEKFELSILIVLQIRFEESFPAHAKRKPGPCRRHRPSLLEAMHSRVFILL